MNTRHLIISLLFILISDVLLAKTNCELAFEGAEGFGACSRGGKGGKILKVTTLNDTDSEGSFR